MKKNPYFQFWNSNPNQRYKKNGEPMGWHGVDCTVRSLSRAMGWGWLQAYEVLCEEGRRQLMTFDDIKVLNKVYERLGFIKHSVAAGVKPTVNEFCKGHPEGTYILTVCGHVVCVDGGRFYDTSDCGDSKVRGIYEKA